MFQYKSYIVHHQFTIMCSDVVELEVTVDHQFLLVNLKIWLSLSIYHIHISFSVMYVNVEDVTIQHFVILIPALWICKFCESTLPSVLHNWDGCVTHINENKCLIKKFMFDALKLSQDTSQFTIGAIQNELRSIFSFILCAVSNQSHLLTRGGAQL